MQLEQRDRFGLVELRAADDDDKEPKIGGYAAVFYRADDAGTEYRLWEDAVERIMPGAFDRAIREDNVVALFNHDSSSVLGRSNAGAGTLTLSVDDVGLRYEITPSDSTLYRELSSMIKRGDIAGSSFQFQIEAENWVRNKDGSEIREIRGVKLYDVGPVTFPAYAATTTQARSRRDEYFEKDRAKIQAEHERRRLYLDSISTL